MKQGQIDFGRDQLKEIADAWGVSVDKAARILEGKEYRQFWNWVNAERQRFDLQCDCSAWDVDYDMFSRDDYTKKEQIAKRLNDGWVEMGMLPWVVEGKDAGFYVWWKRQNMVLTNTEANDQAEARL